MDLGDAAEFPRGAEDRFELMESVPDATIVVGAGGRIAFANGHAQKLFGYGLDELVGAEIELLVPDRLRQGHVEHRDDYARDPRVRPMGAGLDLHGRRKNGTEFPVEISLSPLRAGVGTLVVSTIRDVSERKAFERELWEKNVELQSANRAKDRFLASMSHELRTPLNAIIGFTGTLLMRLPGPLTADQEHQLNIVAYSARHLLSLINDILDLAKVESGQVALFFDPARAAAVVGEVADSLRSLAREKGLKFTTSFSDSNDEFVVVTDRRALHQILLNLANNAVKCTEKGSIAIDVVAVGRGKPHVALNVTDTGIGIKPEDRPRLFQAFGQVDPSSTRRFEGAGLGLHLCARLAMLIGASLTFESAHGQGSTFTLTLPRGSR